MQSITKERQVAKNSNTDEVENDDRPQPAPRSLVDLRQAREARTVEALKMKDEQISILSNQNNKLIEAMDHGEEEISAIQLEKMHIEEENRQLRESNFSVQSKAHVADGELEKIKNESSDRDKQLQIMATQNAELLRLLETEEGTNAKLAAECDNSQTELRELKIQHSRMENASKSYEELAKKAMREGELQIEEIRLLRTEVESLKNHQNESKMKFSVEMESLQEQLRVRKEKQYQLLEKLQSQEEVRRQAEDQVSSMEEKLRELHTKASSAETQLELEMNSKLSQDDFNRKLTFENQALSEENKTLIQRIQMSNQDQRRMETEARESGEQLREMAEKVFQLLERLKLAELGKVRSMEALRTKEEEVHVLKKKNTNLIKESTREGKARVQIQLDKKVLEEQIRALKKHNLQLGQRCKEEARMKVRLEDEKKDAEEKVRTLNGRLSFLLNKLQTDEEAKVIQKKDIEKMEGKLVSNEETMKRLHEELNTVKDSNTTKIQELNKTEETLQATIIKLDALEQIMDEQENMREQQRKKEQRLKITPENPLVAGGRLRFFVESKPTLGIVLLKGKCAKDREWLDINGCNLFLRKAGKSKNTQELLLQKIAEIYGIIATYEEEIENEKNEAVKRENENVKSNKKIEFLHHRLGVEEESKRRTLLKYVNAVKASVSLGEPGCEKEREEVGSLGCGRICLPEASLSDEEVYAISAMLRENHTITELNLRGNLITDEGCRAIASILSGPTSLRSIDLRSNRISRNGIKSITQALERSKRVRHVYVHAGGKIEALGTNEQAILRCDKQISDALDIQPVDSPPIIVDTVCVVDIRDNSTHEVSDTFKEDLFDLPVTYGSSANNEEKFQINKKVGINDKQVFEDYEREKRRKAKEKRDAIKSEKQNREQGWTGRAGGLDLTSVTALDINDKQTTQ